MIYLLLLGRDKSSQKRDMKRAIEMARASNRDASRARERLQSADGAKPPYGMMLKLPSALWCQAFCFHDAFLNDLSLVVPEAQAD